MPRPQSRPYVEYGRSLRPCLATSIARLATGVITLGALDLVLAAVALAACALWLVAAFLLYLSRKPPEPPVGDQTLELGPEPPAVANFLVNDFRVTDDAVPATLIDLAARDVVDIEQRGPGVFYVRLRERSVEVLTSYERRVLERLRRLAHDDVVPAEALTTGGAAESKRWRRRFANEVVADAQARGLSHDALGSRLFARLLAAAAIPAVLVWALTELPFGFLVLVGAGAILGWIHARHPQRETPEGLAAASRWLGVRAELAENEVFPTHSPLTVDLWSRLLAYGAALGVATGAAAPLPMGAESDTDAWSSYGGRWRPVRVSYPRRWPPGWGLDPLAGLAFGVLQVGFGALFLYWVEPTPAGDLFDVLFVLIPAVVLFLGIALVILALADLRSATEVTGPILRLREFGGDDKRRYYVAVDDGRSRAIRAFRIDPRRYLALEQGQVVTVKATKRLGCVRWIIDGPGPAAEAVPV
jgi:hypothetical protein